MRAGTIVRHSFALRNVTAKPVDITYVSVSCTCTRARASSMKIPAGKSASVEVAYLPPFDLHGTYHDAKQAFVYLKGYRWPAAVLEVTGAVRCAVAAQPDHLLLGRVTAGSRATKTLTLFLDRATGLWVTSARSAAPKLATVSLSAPTMSKDGFRTQTLRVTLSPGCPVGALNTQIKLNTSDGRALTVPVLGTVEGPYAADPDVLYFGQIKRGDSRPLEFSLKGRTGQTPRIRSVRSDNPNVVAGQRTGEGDVVSVHLAGTAPSSEIQAKITVTFDCDGSTIVVPVFAYVE